MVKTIFTGHTLNLRNIAAIGPAMQKSDGISREMYLEIYLMGGGVIRHIQVKIEVYTPKIHLEEWNLNIDTLKSKRDALVEDWEKANKKSIVNFL
ncbi:MAG: hypothetical protein LCH91_14020 [Bacteroidetes bacterium]|nr:hypothetical protein [Bacteroidota bacterium]